MEIVCMFLKYRKKTINMGKKEAYFYVILLVEKILNLLHESN